MIWTASRNREQAALVAALYQKAGAVLCERQAVMAGGLRGADKASALAQEGIDPGRYLVIRIDRVLLGMAECGMIPAVPRLSPLEAADLVHGEAQFLAKRLGLRALGDGRNILWDISVASQDAVESWLEAHRQAGYEVVGVFAEISIEESVRRSEAEHRRGHEEYRQGRGYGGRYVPPQAIRALADAGPGPAAPSPSAGEEATPSGPGREEEAGQGMASEVMDLIGAYLAGEITLERLSRAFMARDWPRVPPVCPPGMEAAARAIDDPEPYVPGSFDDVVRAYDLGWLTDTDYEALATAAARA